MDDDGEIFDPWEAEKTEEPPDRSQRLGSEAKIAESREGQRKSKGLTVPNLVDDHVIYIKTQASQVP